MPPLFPCPALPVPPSRPAAVFSFPPPPPPEPPGFPAVPASLDPPPPPPVEVILSNTELDPLAPVPVMDMEIYPNHHHQ